MGKATSMESPPSIGVVRAIGKDLLTDIYERIFLSRGTAFSFDLGYILEEREEDMGFIDNVFGFNVTKIKGKNPSYELRATLPQGVSFRIKENKAFLKREYSLRTKMPTMTCWGPIFEIMVSEGYSNAFYKEKFGQAFSFYNHLLENYPKLIEKLLSDHIREKEFDIATIGIYCWCSYESGDDLYSFSSYGMDSLPNIACCYGMALAMAKTVEKDSTKFAGITLNSIGYRTSYRYSYLEERIHISFNIPETKEESHLKKWM